jgi:3-oxoacyl-[acyl-carrier-protein] synthase-3
VTAIITGSGTCLPDGVFTNDEIAARLGLDPQQIFKSSGIRERRWAEAGITTSSLAAKALTIAVADAGIVLTDVDYLLFGTMTPDRLIPGSAPAVQHALGLPEIPCLDIRAACCNALYGLQLARALVEAQVATNVAICLAEVQSPFLDLSPRAGTLSMLFGDGASALIVSRESPAANSQAEPGRELEVVDVFLATDGKYTDDLGIRCPGSEFGTALTHPPEQEPGDYAPRMVGQSVILQASRRMVAGCRTILERNHLTANDVRWLVPHQANANLLAMVARGLGFPANDDRVISVLEHTGNTSSASVGIALDELRRSAKIKPGDYLLLPAFAAGFTWGAALCQATLVTTTEAR